MVGGPESPPERGSLLQTGSLSMNRNSIRTRASLVVGAAALVVATAGGSALAVGDLRSTPAAVSPDLCQSLGSVPEPVLHVVHQVCA